MTRPTDTSPQRDARTLPPRRVYPFAAIVGQEELKLGLLLNVIAPAVGGVLIMGHRGTGKSTAVRALAELLPPLSKVRDCLYGCDPSGAANLCGDCRARLASNGKLAKTRAPVPVVDLPLNATEDRLAGAINFERAIKEGVRTFEPGLLARAHRGFLYIDEVNLLEDHLVDLLLDVAASGRNRVEREGISVEHPAEFVLVGSGNPEEGELRPQLLDRFGLYTEIRTASDLEERVEIVTRREAFDRDPAAFCARWEAAQASLRRRLNRARGVVGKVRLPVAVMRGIAELCQRLDVDGHRGELTLARASRALAAFENRREVTREDVRRVAAMSLRHRLRRDPLEQTGGGSQIEQAAEELLGAGEGASTESPDSGDTQRRSPKKSPPDEPGGSASDGGGRRARTAPQPDEAKREPGAQNRADARNDGRPARDERPAPPLDARLPPEAFAESLRAKKSGSGSTSRAKRQSNSRANSSRTRGRYVRAVAARTDDLKLALDATMRAAASSQMSRRRGGEACAPRAGSDGRALLVESDGRALLVESGDFRYKQFSRRAGTLYIFAVDTSGSMALNRIAQAKGALARLLRQSYVNRDRVALITFREREGRVLLAPSQSGARAKRLLDALPVGGATPLSSGLLRALEVAGRAARGGTAARVVLLVFTDGHANVASDGLTGGNLADVRRRIRSEVARIGVAFKQLGVAAVVVDTQNRFTSGGEAEALAHALGGRHVHLPSRP